MANGELGRLLFGAGMAIGVASALYLAVAVALRVRLRLPVPRRPRTGARLLSLVGSGLAVAAPEAARGDPSLPDPHHSESHSPPAPPWSEPEGFPPPRPAGRTGEVSPTPRAPGAEDTEVGEPAKSVRRVVVKPGDSLWAIAAEILETSDPARIARYWPRIHRSNRHVIGANPNLILPGQVLELPDETPRR
jgi:resuscitation-promoting factor RpfA